MSLNKNAQPLPEGGCESDFSDQARLRSCDSNNSSAHKLMAKLFEDEPSPDCLPSLGEIGGPLKYRFIGDESSFVLGSLERVDFVLNSADIAREHVSFVRDINGIRIIPILDHKTLVNDLLLSEPQFLAHGSIITLGNKKFVFKEYPDTSLDKLTQNTKSTLSKVEPHHARPGDILLGDSTAKGGASASANDKAISPTIIKTFDRLFLVAIFLVVCGMIIIVTKSW